MSLIYKARNAIEQIVVSPRITRFRLGQRFVISRSPVRIRRVAPRRSLGEKGEPRANYFVAVAACSLSLKHAPAAAHAPNPAPVATSSAAAPIMGTPAPANAPQAPGESAAEVGIAAGATAQFSVKPSLGTVWLTTPGCPAPAGGFNVVLYWPGAIPVMQYLPASLVVPCPTTFPPESATVT